MIVKGGKFFHLSVWPDMVWLSILPDRKNTPYGSRNVPRGWRAWELLKLGGRWRILSWRKGT